MRGRGLLILTLVVAALAAFVWFYERGLPGTVEREARANRLLQIEAEEVSEILVEQAGRRLRFEREPAQEEESGGDLFSLPAEREWRITEPMDWRADRYAVDDLVRALVGLEKTRELEGVDRSDYGLEPPEVIVTLVDGSGERWVVEVGRRLPAGAGRVVALPGDSLLFVVSDAFYANLTRDPGEWRSRELFAAQRGDVESVRLERGEATVRLARRGDEHWIEAPITDRAERELAEGLLGVLVGLRAERFVDDPGAEGELGLDPPGGVVEVAIRGRGEPLRLEWGAESPDEPGEGTLPAHYLRLDRQVVVTRAALGEHLLREPGQWRSRSWTSLPLYQIDRAVIQDQSGALELERDGADWRRGDATILYGPVSDLLSTLADARADRLLSRGEATRAGLAAGEPRLTVTLFPSEGPEQTLKLFALAEDGWPAQVSGRDVVLLLPRSLAAELEDRLEAVRRAEALAQFEEEG